MSSNRTYRCLNCLEHTVSRAFDTSHLSVTCPNCGSFERFVNDAVFQQFRAFEESPPADLDWARLNRTEKLMVSERIVRSSKTLADFSVVDGGAAAEEGEAAVKEGEAAAEEGGSAAGD